MSSCWHINPSERPNFTEIIKQLNKMICDDNMEMLIANEIPCDIKR